MTDQAIFGFGDFPRKDRDRRINLLYKQCQAERRHMVWIETRRILADVSWDCVTLPPDWDYFFHPHKQTVILERLWGIFLTVADPSSRFLGSFFNGWIHDLSIENARLAAQAISLVIGHEVKSVKRRVHYVK